MAPRVWHIKSSRLNFHVCFVIAENLSSGTQKITPLPSPFPTYGARNAVPVVRIMEAKEPCDVTGKAPCIIEYGGWFMIHAVQPPASCCVPHLRQGESGFRCVEQNFDQTVVTGSSVDLRTVACLLPLNAPIVLCTPKYTDSEMMDSSDAVDSEEGTMDLECHKDSLSAEDQEQLTVYDTDVYLEAECVGDVIPNGCNIFDLGQECRSCFASCTGALLYVEDKAAEIAEKVRVCSFSKLDVCKRARARDSAVICFWPVRFGCQAIANLSGGVRTKDSTNLEKILEECVPGLPLGRKYTFVPS